MSLGTYPPGNAALPMPLTIPSGGTGATDAPTARANLGLGTLSVQNANAVNITGGNAVLTAITVGSGAATCTINNAGVAFGRSFAVLDYAGNDVTGFYSTLGRSGGTNRWLLYGVGDAPSYFGGTVGMGSVPDPSAWLTVNGRIIATGPIEARAGTFIPNTGGDNVTGMYSLLANTGGTNRWAVYCGGDAASYFGGAVHMGAWAYVAGALAVNRASGPNVTYQLEVNGSAGKPGGGPFSDTSDITLKTNIEPIPDALAVLLGLQGHVYEWTDYDHKSLLPGPQYGLIANEVQAVVPQWVGETPDGLKTLSIIGFEALTVEALRQLATRLTALEDLWA